ncbi:MAG: YcbK family protein, partial [Pseudomonadota bacterium]
SKPGRPSAFADARTVTLGFGAVGAFGAAEATRTSNADASPSRPGLLSALFGRRDSAKRPAAEVGETTETTKPAIEQSEVRVASAAPKAPTAPKPSVTVRASANAEGLPGFDRERALGINRDDTAASGSDVRAATEPVQVASAAGLARLAPNGLRTQHSGVDVKCLKPALVRMLKQVERHYGKSVVVTSGYRSPSHNRRVRGAKNSLHVYCAAADIQVAGVSKWNLAAYLRSIPGRGGVGTYCHTKSVHIDIGPRRDWNWRCRRG